MLCVYIHYCKLIFLTPHFTPHFVGAVAVAGSPLLNGVKLLPENSGGSDFLGRLHSSDSTYRMHQSSLSSRCAEAIPVHPLITPGAVGQVRIDPLSHSASACYETFSY